MGGDSYSLNNRRLQQLKSYSYDHCTASCTFKARITLPHQSLAVPLVRALVRLHGKESFCCHPHSSTRNQIDFHPSGKVMRYQEAGVSRIRYC